MNLARTYTTGFELHGWGLWLVILAIIVLVIGYRRWKQRRELNHDLEHWPFKEEGGQ